LTAPFLSLSTAGTRSALTPFDRREELSAEIADR
jgi:hypothetical protein